MVMESRTMKLMQATEGSQRTRSDSWIPGTGERSISESKVSTKGQNLE